MEPRNCVLTSRTTCIKLAIFCVRVRRGWTVGEAYNQTGQRERKSPARFVGAQLAYARNDNGVAAECFQFVFCESDTPGRFGQPDNIEAFRWHLSSQFNERKVSLRNCMYMRKLLHMHFGLFSSIPWSQFALANNNNNHYDEVVGEREN